MTLTQILLIIAAIPAHGFAIQYFWMTRKVRKLPEAWHMLTFTAALALTLDVLLLPRLPYREDVLIVLLVIIAIALWWRWGLLWRATRAPRSSQYSR